MTFLRAFTGELVNNKKAGVYRCVVCGKELFLSDTKFDSGSGWPSFWDTPTDGTVRKITDTSHFMTRTEVTCADVSWILPAYIPFRMAMVVKAAHRNLKPWTWQDLGNFLLVAVRSC